MFTCRKNGITSVLKVKKNLGINKTKLKKDHTSIIFIYFRFKEFGKSMYLGIISNICFRTGNSNWQGCFNDCISHIFLPTICSFLM